MTNNKQLSTGDTTHYLSSKTWTTLIALAVTGHLAWAVENTWFGTFAYDRIRPDMSIVATMTSVTAIVVTLTTILMGTLSDRSRSKWGKRRPFIFLGYIFWGLMTALFPPSALIKTTSLAVLVVVVIDSLMTFFGSTANDAAFNAWTAEITPPAKRGKVEGVLQVCLFLAQIISYTLAGILIDRFDNFIFFYILGGLVILVGFVAARKLPEVDVASQDQHQSSFLADLKALFRWQTVKENPELIKLLLMIMISSIGMQVNLPYLVIYVSKTEFGLIGAAIMVGSLLISPPFGLLADKLDRKWMLVVAILMSSVGCLMFSQVRSLVNHTRAVTPLLTKLNNVHIDLNIMIDTGYLEELVNDCCGSEKLLLGSGLPVHVTAGGLSLILYSTIGANHKENILHANWERLQREVCYDNQGWPRRSRLATIAALVVSPGDWYQPPI
jgi:Na+/melibiose symporter-like transporter